MKKRVLTGINTTGTLHLGNYVGALRPSIQQSRSDEVESFYFLADLHALIKCQDPVRLQRSRLQIATTWLAAGLDPEHVTFYRQSDIQEIPLLNWLLDCSCSKGLMNRAHAYKAVLEASVESGEDPDARVSMGLFCYPILMAADILLYQPDYVPVGSDQKQHVELCRDVATRFNNIYGDVFKIPEPYIPKIGARVMSLVSPENKMSKSDKDPNGTVYLLDRPEDIMRKFKKAVTDSDTERCVRYDLANKPGVSNLMSIYSACTGKTFEEIEAEFDGKGYGAFKPAVGEAVVETLRPIREESERLLKDKAYLESVYKAGAEKASYIANKTLRKVYKKVGFVAK